MKTRILMGMVCLMACTPSESPNATTATMLSQEIQKDLPPRSEWQGNIDNKYEITAKLVRTGSTVSGTYQYVRKGQDLKLTGSVQGHAVTLKEFDGAGKQTGTFKGVLRGNQLSGNWEGNGRILPFSLQLKASPSSTTEANVATEAPSLTLKTIEKKGKGFEASMTYPELSGMKDAGLQKKINASLRQPAQTSLDHFVKSAESEPPSEGMVGYDLEVGIPSSYVTPKFVSVLYQFYAYEGGAHPNTITQARTIDLKTGKLLQINDLFKVGFLNKLSELVRTELKKDERIAEIGTDEWFMNGTAPKPDHYKSLVLTQEGLYIVFDAYQIAAYAAGAFEVKIPYTLMKDWIKSGSVLEGFKR